MKFYNCIHREIIIKERSPQAWELQYRYITVFLPRVYFFNSCTAYRTSRYFRMWTKNIKKGNWNESVLIASYITDTETWLRPNPPDALKFVILTASNAAYDENLLIHWWISNKNSDTPVLVIILLDIHITHRCLLLTAYIKYINNSISTSGIKSKAKS